MEDKQSGCCLFQSGRLIFGIMNAFRLIRERLEVSQAMIAAAVGVTQSNVSFYENGQTVPPAVAAKLIEYAATKGLTLSYDHVYGAAELPAVEAKAS